MAKKAIITGISGQDGSYLAELLRYKGYEVHGIIRRSSTFNTRRIDHIPLDPHVENGLHLHYGDLTDGGSLTDIIYNVQPDEIYNLAAQSHVRVSFDMPEYTGDVVALGTTRLLDAIRRSGSKARIYQASSSEMFGSSTAPQNENTVLYPQSPYGCAKVYAYNMVRNYREGYGMFACNGILFNHETIVGSSPLFVRQKGSNSFDIKPIREIVPFDEGDKRYQSNTVDGLQVWGKSGWVDVTYASAYPHDMVNDNKHPRIINARCGSYSATGSHVAFMSNSVEKETRDIVVGDRMEKIDLPTFRVGPSITMEEAELMGMMVADGSITYRKKGIGLSGKFTKTNKKTLERFDELWRKVTGGTTKWMESRSGFKPENIVGQLRLIGGNDWLRSVDLYTQSKHKRVPSVVLNGTAEVAEAFLRGYNRCDGLKENRCTYDFRNFKTNSPTLAMGLWYLIWRTTGQEINLTVETKTDGRVFYSMNILSNNVHGEKGQHLRKDNSEVKKIVELDNYDGWFYDIETISGEFHCGVGRIHVHNSPRRGPTFVTRKITKAIAEIVAGKRDKLYLGNLWSLRDWGYAPEYVEAMWLMMQQDEPGDYVIGTGKSYTVYDFLMTAFEYAGIDVSGHVEYDERYNRPTEVNHLRANAEKANEVLGWHPTVDLDELIEIMVDADMQRMGLMPIGAGIKSVREKFEAVPYRAWHKWEDQVISMEDR